MASGVVDRRDNGDLSDHSIDVDGDNFSDDAERMDFTASEDIQAIKHYDNTVEIVGYIDGIESPRLVGVKNNEIFKFFLNNNNGERVQVTCWNAECDRVEPSLRTNYIVHVDGAYAKPSLVSNFNKGTVNFELIVQSNTIVNVLGKHAIQESELSSQLVPFSDVLSYKTLIRTRGYIKSNFYLIKNQHSKSSNFGCGSITDGVNKLEVRISELDADHLFLKGNHIEITGYIQSNANPVYLQVKDMTSIRLIDNSVMSASKLIIASKPLVKPVADQTAPKKQKTS